MALFIENDFLRVGVKEHGAELTSVKNRRGYEYIWQGDEKFWAKQCPVLFPICGRLHKKTYRYNGKVYKMEAHGFASRSDFKAEKISDTEMAFTLKENEETLAQYPFRFVFSVRYRLENDSLSITYKTENTDDKALFFNFGSHEAYRTEGAFSDWSVEFEKREDLFVNVQPVSGFLNGERKLLRADTKELTMEASLFDEDSVILDGLQSRSVTLKRKGEKVVTVDFEGFDHLLFWTKVGAPYLCIEPWNGIPDYDGFQGDLSEKHGVIRLESGKSYESTHKIRFYDVDF